MNANALVGKSIKILAGATLMTVGLTVFMPNAFAGWGAVTVTFISDGGSTVPTEGVQGLYAWQPTDPTRAGYTFDGWYSDSGLTTPYNFSTVLTGNITLYAKLTAIPYTVTYNGNSASGTAPTDSK